MSTIREEKALVRKLSRVQQEKLRANSYKSHWRDEDVWNLVLRLREELSEMVSLLRDPDAPPKWLWEEAADVANFAAMIADLYEQETTG